MVFDEEVNKAIDKAFKALDAIEEIRTEIEQKKHSPKISSEFADGLQWTLDVIDKYTK